MYGEAFFYVMHGNVEKIRQPSPSPLKPALARKRAKATVDGLAVPCLPSPLRRRSFGYEGRERLRIGRSPFFCTHVLEERSVRQAYSAESSAEGFGPRRRK